MGSVLRCQKCQRNWFVGTGMGGNDSWTPGEGYAGPEDADQVRDEGPDGKYHCKVCGSVLTSKDAPLLLWD
ncbi:MAG: hypothetical protein A4E30_00314 [Methanomassiliicoccales archaeon PtaB.Bin215]|nr:MAG: hypothetical protein A4E30_00314 [Methanomassiliicoccales archaeon PtaB.Bin215]